MSIPGVGPSIAGQVVQEVTVSMCDRFLYHFQNRLVAATALTVSSAVGIVGGLFIGFWLKAVSKPLIEKIFPSIDGKYGRKSSAGYKFCKNAVLFITWAAVFVTLNVIVSKCLKLPFSRPASAGISVMGAGLGFGVFWSIISTR